MKKTVDFLNDRIALGAKLRFMRQEAGFATAYAYSKAVGLDQAKIGSIEKGHVGYTIDTLTAYLEGVGLDLVGFIGGIAAPAGKQLKTEPTEKKPVGRPAKEKPVRRVPVLEYVEFEDGAHPRLQGKLIEFAGISGSGPLLIAQEKAWARFRAFFVIVMATNDWFIVNNDGWPLAQGRAANVDAAKAAIDHERRQYDGIYDDYDFGAEDAVNEESEVGNV